MKNLSKPGLTQPQMKQRGFTLIELMVVLVIVGILLKIAVPAYTNSQIRANRTDAKTALLNLATLEEKYYSVTNTYTNSAAALYGGSTASFPMSVQSGSTAYYTINIPAAAVIAATTTTPASFTATATPISGTSQANDPCGALTITNTGVTASLGSQTTGCW